MTRIEGVAKADDAARVLGVTPRKGQTLLTIRTSDPLWGDSNFLGNVFTPIGDLGVSTDLVVVSQYTVSLVLDYIPGGIDGEEFTRLLAQLKTLGTVDVKSQVAVVSVIGENIRKALPELGQALKTMTRDVYMMSQSSEDLSISFVVDEDAASGVVQALHNYLLCGTASETECIIDDTIFGQSWDELKTEFLKVE